MTYTYKCGACNTTWDDRLPMSDRDVPLSRLCSSCGQSGQIKRIVNFAPSITHESAKTLQQRAGSGWNDVLTKIKKKSGRHCTIQTR